ncbi:MAG: hypothetical protein AABX93_01385 [Nanoarchaeota archaeon]
MKIGAFLLLLLIVPSVYAIDFDMKSSFDKDETLLAKISGNFMESISADDLTLYRGGTRIPMTFSVREIDDSFYIYAQLLGKTEGNYTIFVEGVKYFQSGNLINENISKSFIISGNFTDFKINQGYIYSEGDFFVEVENLKDNEISVASAIIKDSEESSGGGFFDFFFSGSSSDGNATKIQSGQTKKINFNAEDFSAMTVQKIELSADNTVYQIPVFLTSNISKNETTTAVQKIKFEPSELNITLPFNSKTTRIVYLFNNGENDLENVTLLFSDSISPYISSSAKNISSLSENSSERIEFEFSSVNVERTVEGQIRAKTADNYYAYIAVFLSFVESYQPTNETGGIIPSCLELNGIICSETQSCGGGTQIASDGVCCLGTCSEVVKTSYGKYIGWGMIALVILGLIFFYFKKYRKVHNVVDLLNPKKR